MFEDTNPTVEVILIDDRLSAPVYAKPGDAAIDLRVCSLNGEPLQYKWRIMPGEHFKIGTGLAVHLGSMTEDGANYPLQNLTDMAGVAGLVIPRSSTGGNGLVLDNTVGLIDQEYQGELIIKAHNRGPEPLFFEPLERVAQYVIVPIFRFGFKVVSNFTITSERGAGGFGSTGNV